jgi:hypothetical protein
MYAVILATQAKSTGFDNFWSRFCAAHRVHRDRISPAPPGILHSRSALDADVSLHVLDK